MNGSNVPSSSYSHFKGCFLPSRPDRPIKGFSLVEMLLVTLLLSVVVGLAVPNFKHSYQHFRLKKAADDLTYSMRFAQSRAVMRNRRLELQFEPGLNRYQYSEEIIDEQGFPVKAIGYANAVAFKPLSGRMTSVKSIADDLRVVPSLNPVYFYPDGRVDQGDIEICDQKSCYTISTKARRGHIEVFKSKIDH